LARSHRAIVPDDPKETSAWSAVVLMASAVGAFVLLALFLANNHRWTDHILAALPSPGGSLANDGIVAEQLRITGVRTEHLTLADRSVALLFEATIVNDSSIPVRAILVDVEGWRDDKSVGTAEGTCGKNVSVRLLKRLSRDEVTALMRLETPSEVLAPGEKTECQVALTQLRTEVEEVSYRVASAEPGADHAGVAGSTSGDPDPTRQAGHLPDAE
jgi:hypothetical protein